MGTFRTNHPKINQTISIIHSDKIVLIGSCFSKNIGKKLTERKFETLINPYGISYNPISIAQQLDEIIELKKYTAENLIEHNDLWNSFQHHSSFSSNNQTEVLDRIKENISTAHQYLKNSKILIITFGTAWVYRYNQNIVANCHKIPSKQFTKSLLSVAEITTAYKKIIKKLNAFNPNLKIVFTVSPIRHVKDGVENNQLSKSTVRLAINALLDENRFYFPAYEILLDDLRDYRFYESDMLHPNETAVNYIWDYFSNFAFSEKTKNFNVEIEKINAALSHKAFYPNSEKHKQFLNETNNKIKAIEEKLNKRF